MTPATPPKDLAQKQTRYRRLREAGLCVDCAGPGRAGVTRCLSCEQKRVKGRKKREEDYDRRLRARMQSVKGDR